MSHWSAPWCVKKRCTKKYKKTKHICFSHSIEVQKHTHRMTSFGTFQTYFEWMDLSTVMHVQFLLYWVFYVIFWVCKCDHQSYTIVTESMKDSKAGDIANKKGVYWKKWTKTGNKAVHEGSKKEDRQQGGAQAMGKFNVNNYAGEHKTGKHTYMGLMRERTRGSWEWFPHVG